MLKTNYFILLLLAAALLTGCHDSPDMEVTVHSCAAVPFHRACATCFSVEDRVYVFGGRDSLGVKKNDLWRYDASTDQWTSVGTTPLKPRVNATACVTRDGKVYIGLGFNGTLWQDSCYLCDWWEFNEAAGTWKRLADYPNRCTDHATAFADEGELYVGYGFRYNYRRDMFRYDIAANQWDSIDVQVDFFGYPPRSFGGTGCSCQGRHFMGTGYYQHSLDWWAELVDGTHWEQRKAVPGRARTLAACTATEQYIYLTAGLHYGGVNTTGEVMRDIRRYDPQTDKWTYVAVLPEGIFNHICFHVGKRVYIGLGETEEWKTVNQLYYIIEE